MTAYILIFIAAFIILLRPVFAQDASTGATTRKQLLQQKIDTRKENVQNKITTMKEKMASREAILKARLQTFRDKKKAETAERVNTNLNKINENQTAQMQSHLGKMSALLNKLEARVNQASSKTAIAEAREAIASASSAVKTQSEKDYTIQITSESKVKSDAQNQRQQLKTDLLALRKQVIGAKQKVADAISIAKTGAKALEVKEGTASGQQ